MSRFWTYFTFSSLVLGVVACTDGRLPRQTVQLLSTASPFPNSLVPAASVQVNSSPTDSFQMVMKGSSLFLTGQSFGFSRWETGPDPENPLLTFASSVNPAGAWRPDWYASGGLAIYGQTAVMSGTVGASVVSLAQTTLPIEVQRYPAPIPGSVQVPTADAYIYSALVSHPTKPILYGFRRQGAFYTIDLSQGYLKLSDPKPYGNAGESVCCALGAAVFQNKVYVAFRDRLLIYSIADDGSLVVPPQESTDLNATNVVASANRLYVQHEPTRAVSAGSSSPSGIYVFDANRNNIAYFAAGNPRRFTVSGDDRFLYTNLDGISVKIYRIQWTN
jgi:hypothetical protein